MALEDDDISYIEAERVLQKYGYEYQKRPSSGDMLVKDSIGNIYIYYPTTHRWALRSARSKHYRSKSTEDFVNRFLKKNELEEKVYKDILYETTGFVENTDGLFHLVEYIWEMFEQGDKIWDVKSKIVSEFRIKSKLKSKEIMDASNT